MSQLIQNAKQQYIDGNGNPLAGGRVAYYLPGTLTAATTWQDQAQTTPNPNPITLDANGECIAWGADSTSYRQIVKDSLGNTIWDQVSAIVGFLNPMTAVGDLMIGGASGAPSRLPIGASGAVPVSNGTTYVARALTATDVGADAAGTAAALGGIGAQATLVLSGYAIAANAGVITVSASAPSGTPADGQLWFQHA